MKTVSLKLPNYIDKQLEEEARERGCSKSLMIREALAEYFVEIHKTKPGSFLDQAQHLCGSLVGPADLSTNPKHMDKYGE